jgi:hypothetical protein
VARIDGLRPGADRLSEQYRIVPHRVEDAVHEELAPYRMVPALSDGTCGNRRRPVDCSVDNRDPAGRVETYAARAAHRGV